MDRESPPFASRQGLIAFTFALVLIAACRSERSGSQASDTTTKPKTEATKPNPKAAAADESAEPERPKLPPEPTPPFASKASEAPKIAAEVAASKPFQAIWEEKALGDRQLFLTALSEAVITLNTDDGNATVPNDTMKALEAKGLTDPFLKLSAFFARKGEFPADVTAKVTSFITAIAKEPHLGVWSPAKNGAGGYDFAGLAYWFNRDSADYLREFLAARGGGPIGWENLKNPARPYLVRERAALERLALLTKLTSDEKERLATLKASKLGDEPPEDVELSDLLSEYGSNEVRADEKFKAKVVEFGGVAGEVKRSTIGGITLAIGSGKRFEHPEVTCFFDDEQKKAVMELNKGDHIRVRGKVKGLMIDVLVEHCEIAR